MISLRSLALGIAVAGAVGVGHWLELRRTLDHSLADALATHDAPRVRSLLHHGASPLVKSKSGITTAMFMAGYGSVHEVGQMLDAGVEVNARYKEAASALIWAAA